MDNFVPQVNYGVVGFQILKGEEKEIKTVNGTASVIALDVKLVDPDTSKSDIIKGHLIFINDHPKLDFAVFVQEYSNKIDPAGFDDAAELIGITGRVNFYKNKKNHDALNKWDFDIPSPTAQDQLYNHIQNNTQLNNPFQTPFQNVNELFHNNQNDFMAPIHTDANVVENTDVEYEWSPFNSQEWEDNGHV